MQWHNTTEWAVFKVMAYIKTTTKQITKVSGHFSQQAQASKSLELGLYFFLYVVISFGGLIRYLGLPDCARII